jgi:hypothetical protein
MNVVAEPLEQLERCDADFREEGVDETGDEKPDTHGSFLRSSKKAVLFFAYS